MIFLELWNTISQIDEIHEAGRESLYNVYTRLDTGARVVASEGVDVPRGASYADLRVHGLRINMQVEKLQPCRGAVQSNPAKG